MSRHGNTRRYVATKVIHRVHDGGGDDERKRERERRRVGERAKKSARFAQCLKLYGPLFYELRRDRSIEIESLN